MSKKRLYKDIICYVLAFFIAISLVTLCLSYMFSRGLFNKDTFLSGFSTSSFYEEKIELLQNNLNERLETAGLPEECGDEVIVSGAVTVEINNVIKQIINNQEVKVNYEKPGEALRNNIIEYLKSEGISNYSDISDAIDLIVKETEKDYKTQLSFDFVNKFYNFFEKYDSIVFKVEIASLVVLIISSLAILFFRNRVYRGVRFVECGLFAGSVLTFILTQLMKHEIVKYVSVEAGAYRSFIISFINKSFNQGKYIFAVGLLLVVLLNIVNRYLKKQVI